MIKVSVVVPVYNSAEYMHKAIESILSSTLNEIELVAVDDCSTDNSVELLEEYKKKYGEKIRIVRQSENCRQGAARNEGIRVSGGEYIAFVDSDDYIEPDMLQSLYNTAKAENAELCGGDFFITAEKGDAPKRVEYSTFCAKEDRSAYRSFLKGCGMFWTRIYKKSFLLDNGIFFPEKTFYEDAYFNFYACLLANKVAKVDKCFYHYVQREGSTVQNRNAPHQYERIKIADLIYDSCEQYGSEYGKTSFEIEYRFLCFHAQTLLYTCLGQFDEPSVERLSEIRDSILARMPKYKKTEAYKEMSADFKWYLNRLMRSPRYVIWCYKHNIRTYINAVRHKLCK